jgi:hypothetical protein
MSDPYEGIAFEEEKYVFVGDLALFLGKLPFEELLLLLMIVVFSGTSNVPWGTSFVPWGS